MSFLVVLVPQRIRVRTPRKCHIDKFPRLFFHSGSQRLIGGEKTGLLIKVLCFSETGICPVSRTTVAPLEKVTVACSPRQRLIHHFL